MRPPRTPSQKAAIELMAMNIGTFLLLARVGNDDRWFSGEDIAAELVIPDHMRMIYLHAFACLPFDELEINGDMIRYKCR